MGLDALLLDVDGRKESEERRTKARANAHRKETQ
jgi:hypothetical protein